MNAINLIVPYRYEGMWVFDDPRVGLDKEPFVSGADTMIDRLVADIANGQKGFSAALLRHAISLLYSKVGVASRGVWRQLVLLA